MGGGNRMPFVLASRGRYNENGDISQNYEVRGNEFTNTITTVQKDNMVLVDNSDTKTHSRVRRFTPKECWRLFDFSDEDFEKARAALNNTYYHGRDKSSSRLYEQAGNTIVINTLSAILKQLNIKEHIDAVEFFCGIGAQRKALQRAGIDFTAVDAVDINKYSLTSYNAINGTNFEPQDITKWDKNIHIDMIFHSSPCLASGTLVLTKNNGYIPIEKVTVGDYVLTHSNTYEKVLNVIDKGVKNVLKVKSAVFDKPLEVTPNHKFYVRECKRIWNIKNKGYEKRFEAAEWKEIKDCNVTRRKNGNISSSYFMGVPINQNSIIPQAPVTQYTRGKLTYDKSTLPIDTENFWYFIGRYLGDGWLNTYTSNGYENFRTFVCCGRKDAEQFEKNMTAFKMYKSKERTTYRYSVTNKELYNFLLQFGKGAKNKRLPGFVFDLPINLLKSLMQGYMDSDGHISGNRYSVSSISRELVYGFAQIAMKVYHTVPHIYYSKRPETYVIEGRTVHQNDTYLLSFYTKCEYDDQYFYENGMLWVPITDIKDDNSQRQVWDLTVENSHSFTANLSSVHNCQSFSFSGKGEGGDEGSGTRSSLMHETKRIVAKAKPKYVIWENVKGALSKKHRHNFEQYISDMDERGYNTYYQILNSKDYGTPQSRERIFAVSIRKDIDVGYEFPKPIPLTTCLQDVLEDNVDEKYYVKKELSDKIINSIKDKIVSNTVRAGGRASIDRHSWDLVYEKKSRE